MKKTQLYTVLATLSLVGYAWLGWNVVEDSATPPTCLFKAATHLPCPSCGTTRALVLLTEGEIGESLLVNPIGVILALALMIVPLWIVFDTLRRRDSLFRMYVATERRLGQNKWLSFPAVAVVLLNWYWNIAKGL